VRNGVEIVLNEEHVVLNFLLLGERDCLLLWLLGMKKVTGALFLLYSSLIIHPF
jgi:hypothetical protein